MRRPAGLPGGASRPCETVTAERGLGQNSKKRFLLPAALASTAGTHQIAWTGISRSRRGTDVYLVSTLLIVPLARRLPLVH
ncbi:hypothetical protein E0H51_28065 [Rhizobium leguminosarum bv. viciae]|nr:hypothetical protein E0H51_28065 [Rhizobium leguminosarum bv. viciae]